MKCLHIRNGQRIRQKLLKFTLDQYRLDIHIEGQPERLLKGHKRIERIANIATLYQLQGEIPRFTSVSEVRVCSRNINRRYALEQPRYVPWEQGVVMVCMMSTSASKNLFLLHDEYVCSTKFPGMEGGPLSLVDCFINSNRLTFKRYLAIHSSGPPWGTPESSTRSVRGLSFYDYLTTGLASGGYGDTIHTYLS